MNSTRSTPARPGGSDEQVATALARSRITDVLLCYLDAIGRSDWPAVAACFTPTAVLDYGTPGVRGVDDNLKLLRAGMERMTATSTLLGLQSCIAVNGQSAKSDMAALTAHTQPPATNARIRMSVVRYEDWWSETAVGWQISRRICHHEVKGWFAAR